MYLFGNHLVGTGFWCLVEWNRSVFLCLLMNAGYKDSKQEHSKKHPKDVSPSNRGRLLSTGALMFQIHDEA